MVELPLHEGTREIIIHEVQPHAKVSLVALSLGLVTILFISRNTFRVL
jgi:hypothetical protein